MAALFLISGTFSIVPLSSLLLTWDSLEPTNLNVGQANLLLPQCISSLLQHNHLPCDT